MKTMSSNTLQSNRYSNLKSTNISKLSICRCIQIPTSFYICLQTCVRNKLSLWEKMIHRRQVRWWWMIWLLRCQTRTWRKACMTFYDIWLEKSTPQFGVSHLQVRIADGVVIGAIHGQCPASLNTNHTGRTIKVKFY